MFIEFIRAFILIFFAEMGDKSQILAMTFATKYSVKKVLIGLTIGIFLNCIVAVLIGSQLTHIIPIDIISFFTGIIFVIFGVMSLHLVENEILKVNNQNKRVIMSIALLFFLGELGDKTQLTTLTLSSDSNYPLVILFGTVSGMILTSVFGIIIGKRMGKKVPVVFMKLISSVIFILIGCIKIVENPMEIDNTYVYVILLSLFVVYLMIIIHFIRCNRANYSLYIRTSTRLHHLYKNIEKNLENICLGNKHCGACAGDICLLGYTKSLVENILSDKPINIEFLDDKTIKDFDPTKVREAYNIVMNGLKDTWQNERYQELHIIRNIFELMLYNETIKVETYEQLKIEINKKS